MPKNGISLFALASSTPLGNENGSPYLTDWAAEVKCFVVVCLRKSRSWDGGPLFHLLDYKA